MKRIIRLTESDLTRIVKRIINEQTWGGILDMPETGQEVTGMVGINQNVASKTKGQVDAALMTEVKKNHPLFLNYLKSKGFKETSTKLILNSGPFVITYQYEINPTWKWPGNGKIIITKPDTKKYGLYNLDMTDKFKKIKPLFKAFTTEVTYDSFITIKPSGNEMFQFFGDSYFKEFKTSFNNLLDNLQ